jgi:hypothetical protein
LQSKPVKKRKDRSEAPPSLAMLWADESKKLENNKMEDQLDYIEEYFSSYVKPPLKSSVSNHSPVLNTSTVGPNKEIHQNMVHSNSVNTKIYNHVVTRKKHMQLSSSTYSAQSQLNNTSKGVTVAPVNVSTPAIANMNGLQLESSKEKSLENRYRSKPIQVQAEKDTNSVLRDMTRTIEEASVAPLLPPKKFHYLNRRPARDIHDIEYDTKLKAEKRQRNPTPPVKTSINTDIEGTQMSPIDHFDCKFQELDLSFPEKLVAPRTSTSPKKVKLKSNRRSG